MQGVGSVGRCRAAESPVGQHDLTCVSESRTMGETQIDSVVRQITDAFADVLLEDGISLREADVIDDYGTDEERAAARRRDVSDDWQRIPDEDIEQYSSVLCFMDEAGLRFHLPAYMRFALRKYRESESMSADFTIYRLCDPEDIVRLLAYLTEDQIDAVRMFLNTCLEIGDDYLDVADVPLALRLWQGDQDAAAKLRAFQNERIAAATQLVQELTARGEGQLQSRLCEDSTDGGQNQGCRLIQRAGQESGIREGQPDESSVWSRRFLLLLSVTPFAGLGYVLYFRHREHGMWWLLGVAGIGVAFVAFLLDLRRQRRDAE